MEKVSVVHFLSLSIFNARLNEDAVISISSNCSAHPGQQPILVIRLKELLISVVQLNVKAACFGGSHQFYYDRLDAFLQSFVELGVKFVFFGGFSQSKAGDRVAKQTWRGDRDYKKYLRILQSIDRSKQVKIGARSECRTLLGLYEEGLAAKYGEYRYCNGGMNHAIVNYVHANSGDVVAVLAKDSDFLVYDLAESKYWSCAIEHLNFGEMMTFSFDRPAMLTYLKLSPYQFHVMAAILAALQDNVRLHYGHAKFGKATKQARTTNQQKIYDVWEVVQQRVAAHDNAPNFAALAAEMFNTRIDEYCGMIKRKFDEYKVDRIEPIKTKEATSDAHDGSGDGVARKIATDVESSDDAAGSGDPVAGAAPATEAAATEECGQSSSAIVQSEDHGLISTAEEDKIILDSNCNVSVPEGNEKSTPVIDEALIQRASIKNRNIHAILADEIIIVDVNFIDLGRWNHPNAMSFTSLFVIVFKRAMGLVLKSRRGSSKNVLRRRFLMKPRDGEKFKVLNKILLYPDCE